MSVADTSGGAAQVEAVLFDFGLVLSGPPNPAVWGRMRELTGLGEEVLQRSYWRPRLDYDRGSLTGVDYWAEVARVGGSELDAKTLRALLDADTRLWTDPNEPMVDWAKRLQRAGMRTGILSNLGDAITAGLLERWPWITAFHSLVWSHRTGFTKPAAESYRHALEALEIAPGRVLFIDDRAENVAGAEAAGMQAIFYVDQAKFEQEMERRGLGALWRV